jgi:hypothetical protein
MNIFLYVANAVSQGVVETALIHKRQYAFGLEINMMYLLLNVLSFF